MPTAQQANTLDVAKHKQLLLDEINRMYEWMTKPYFVEDEDYRVRQEAWLKYCDLLWTYESLQYKD